jgi:hypothetical protein
MAGVKLDGAGAQKMKTLEEAMTTMQTIHGHVERMAIEVKNQKGAGVIPQQIKRIAVPLQGQLKGQFGMIADMIANMILGSTRGGGDQQKVRVLRESVGQIRQALDFAASRVKDQHSVQIETAGGDE